MYLHVCVRWIVDCDTIVASEYNSCNSMSCIAVLFRPLTLTVPNAIIYAICFRFCFMWLFIQLKSWGEENMLLVFTILGVLLGLLLGFLGRMLAPSTESIMLISFPGEILMGMLKMLILPLIVSSMISGKFYCNKFLYYDTYYVV